MLANEEVGHLKAFYDLYKGGEFGSDLKEYMASPPDGKSMSYQTLEKAIDEETHEQKALEIDLKEEKDIDSLFSSGGTTALLNTISGLDDFESIAFLVVRDAA